MTASIAQTTTVIIETGDYQWGLVGNVPRCDVVGGTLADPGYSTRIRQIGREWESELYGWAQSAQSIIERIACGRSSAGPLRPEWIRHDGLREAFEDHAAQMAAIEAKAAAERAEKMVLAQREAQRRAAIAEHMATVRKTRKTCTLTFENAADVVVKGPQYGDFIAHPSLRAGRKVARLYTVTHVPTAASVTSSLEGAELARELAYRMSLVSLPKDIDPASLAPALRTAYQAFLDRDPIPCER